MRVEKLSTKGIKKMHEAIRDVLAEDDKKPQGQKEYFAREFPDWRELSERFEAELKKSNEAFDPIKW